MRAMRRGLLCGLVLLLSSSLYGQEFRATLTGRVLDPSEAPIVSAKVRVTNTGTNETRDAVTDSQGNYTVPFLRPGIYSVRAEAMGFKTTTQQGLELNVNQAATLDIKLEIGAVVEQVTVTAEAPLLESTSGDMGGLIDEQSVKEYPLNTRNPFMLAMLVAGVNFDGEMTYQRPFDNGAIANWSVNGSNRRNEFLLDGAPNNAQAGGNNIAMVPPVDSVLEFKIQTNAYDAQYGRSGGGVINVVLKSGGNRLKGTLYEFARRSAWDANSFQNNARCVTVDAKGQCHGAPKEGHWLDQYGVQLDGPVYLPKLYNGHNKTFFLLNYERYREGTPQPLVLSTPEPELRDGDFSKLVDARGRLIAIYDPATGRYQGSTWVRDPFAGNIIPKERINPTARALVNYFPLPNTKTPGVDYSRSNLFISGGAGTARDRFYNLITKIDQNIGDRNRIFVRLGRNDRTEMRTYNGLFDKPGADGQLPLYRRNWAGVVDWTSTVSPSMVLDVRASMAQFVEGSTSEANKGFDLTKVGFSKSFIDQLPYGRWFGRYNIQPYKELGRYPSQNITNTFTVFPSLSRVRGSRTLKTGVDLRWIQYSTQNYGNIMEFASADTFTRADYSRSDGLSGNGLATWLLGTPTSGTIRIQMFPIYMYRYFAPWVQQDWKVTRKLTLNFGFRWDVNMPPSERFNRLNRGFDADVVNPVDSLVNRSGFPELPTLRGGLLFAGVNGVPRGAADLYLHTYQPRIGFAYALNHKTVVRGGWGRYYINPSNNHLQNTGYNANTSMTSSADSNRTASSNLYDPYPVINQPTGNSKGLLTYLGNGFNFVNSRFGIPPVHQFSLSIQRALTPRARVDISYAGNRGYRMENSKGFNEEEDSSIRDRCNYLLGATSQIYCTQTFPNPFRNVPGFEGTTHYTASTRSRYELLRPFPQFTSGLTEYMRNDGLSWYNSLMASFNMRAKGGVNINANYTFSKNMERNDFQDPMNNVMQQGITGNDRPHKIIYSMIYQLPVGKGRRWFNKSHGWKSHLISGWEHTVIFQSTSGRTWTLPTSGIYLKDARNPKFTWDASKIQAVLPCTLNWSNSNVVTWQAYSQDYGCTEPNWIITPNYNPPRYTNKYDNRVRLQTMRLVDASLNKTTRIKEKYSIQFRLESFNVLNSFFVNTRQFDNSMTSANFGSLIKAEVSAPQSNYPRHIQMAVKFIW